MRLLLLCAVMALAKGSSCPEGWSQFRTACYKYIPEKLNWATAEKICLGQCANLASVMNSAEDLFIRKLIKSKSGANGVTWIGAQDSALEGLWFWSDGQKMTYKHFATTKGKSLNCARTNFKGRNTTQIILLKAITSFVTMRMLLLCAVIALIGAASARCPRPWMEFDGRCFTYVGLKKSWGNAERICLGLGGNLASVQTHGDHVFIQKLIKTKSGKDLHSWIGGYDSAGEGIWLWSDGTPMNYAEWPPKQPDNWRGNENCLAINWTSKRIWGDLGCWYKLPFVCARKAL